MSDRPSVSTRFQRSYGRRAAVTAVQRYLPENVVTNDEVATSVDTSDEWIRERCGILERRILKGQPTSHMATEVAQGIIAQRGLDPREIDLIIVATITPDMMFPATACIVQDRIGAKRAWGFDLSAACTGFIYAVATGAQFIESGVHNKVLVIGADKMSSITDEQDRSTCVLFGDGAGAVLLEPTENEGLIDFELHCDGSGGDDLLMPGGGSLNPASKASVEDRLHYIRQDGKAVYKFAVLKMAEVSNNILERNGFTVDSLALFVPHQANLRIITATAERMGLSMEKVMVNIDRYANTTAGTVPIALSEAAEQGRIRPGDLVQLTAVGGGLTWGSALLRWEF